MYWNYITKGMSQAELIDLEKARDQLEHYDKLYTLIEYVSSLNEGITCLEKKIQTNDETVPMNVYRQCPANQPGVLIAEIEDIMKAYYNLLDDCKDYPLWERKFQEDLGQSISSLGLYLEE